VVSICHRKAVRAEPMRPAERDLWHGWRKARDDAVFAAHSALLGMWRTKVLPMVAE